MTSLLRCLLAGCILALIAGVEAAAPLAVPVYRAGETARVDVVTPYPLVILDKEKTADSKLKQAQQIPSVYRWLTNSTEAIVSRMHVKMAAERAKFLEALAKEYPKLPLTHAITKTEPWRLFWTNYVNTHTNSPASKALARVWSTNGNERVVLKSLEDRLIAAAGHYIRPEEIDQDTKLGWNMKLVPARDMTTAITLADAEKSDEVLRKGEMIGLVKARSDLARDFANDEKPLARFSITLLEPNCMPEAAITREWRHAKTKDIFHVQRFAAGERVIRAGQVVTPLAAAALDEIRVKMVAAQAQQGKRAGWPMIAGISSAAGVMIVAGGWIAWGVRRRRAATMDLEVATQRGVNVDPILREQIASKVSRLLGYTFIQKLLTDRSQSLNTVALVAQETREIESRIETIQQQVQQRYVEYEIRIAKLEQELAAAEEQTRDLIRAKIVLAKQELEAFTAEQNQGRRWN